jgi:hypothetical protein
MVLRGGYGIFFEHGTADEANTGSLEGSSPIVLSMTQQFPTGWSSIGQGHTFPLNVTSIPTKAVWPYVQQWSFSVEREMPLGLLATFAYVGSKGTHLTAERELNQLAPISSASNPFKQDEPLLTRGTNPYWSSSSDSVGDCTVLKAWSSGEDHLVNGATITKGSQALINLTAACYGAASGGLLSSDVPTIDPNSLRTFAPGIGQIYSLENIANSNYNAFQATARRSRGAVTLGVAYTYSHSFDNASDRSDATFVNSFDLRANRASSNFDQRQLFRINYVYSMPLLRWFDSLMQWAAKDPSRGWEADHPHTDISGSRIAKALLGQWELSGITLFETGIPFTVVNGGSSTGVGALDNAGIANGVGAGSYPDLIASPSGRRPSGGNNSRSIGPVLLNPGAFAAPRGLTFGTAGRNVLNNPSRLNFDMALLKQFVLGESSSVEFRAEAFNVFNHTQFRIFDPTLGNQSQNTITCYGGYASYYSAAGGDGVDCLTGSSFLHPVDAHRPRTLQLAIKLSF